MPPHRYNVYGAMFDVKPVDPSGAVDVSKIQSISSKVNLRKSGPMKPQVVMADAVPAQLPPRTTVSAQAAVPQHPAMLVLTKEALLRELESTLDTPQDHRAILASIGAQITDGHAHKRPRYKPVMPPNARAVEDHHDRILAELHHSRHEPAPQAPVRPAAPQMDGAVPTLISTELPLERLQDVEQWMAKPRQITAEPARILHESSITPRSKKKYLIAALLMIPLTAAGWYAVGLKDRVISQGNQAVQNLESAKDNLSAMDFSAASENFLSAYENFSKAGNQLNVVGASISSLLADLPGAEKLKSAQSMIEIGKLLADTGKSMSDAMAVIAKTGIILNPKGGSNVLLTEIIDPLNTALSASDTNLKKVRVLLSDIDTSVIPDDKRPVFDNFKTQFPQLQELVTQGSDFAQFLETLVSMKGTKRYLVLFQNSTELRPTGGFPGSYAVLTFEKGRLKDYKVDDVYNIDGQIKELVVPPKQLQHITPTWAMRDANWFIDFPTSAKKISSFYKKEAGVSIDGVITLNPDVFTRILKIVGPVEMPAYHLTITADNFLATVQKEVEYGNHKEDNKPKQIILDMAPIVMERLYSADKDAWLAIFNTLVDGLEHKDVLMYFKDLNLQSFALDKGFAGEVKQNNSDYLMITSTNVKGSKTDAVTDTVVKMSTKIENGEIRHTLVIGRTNNGGKSEYGFYNKQNPSFMRVLVPLGSKLESIAGQSIPGYSPLVTYDDHFVKDEDLVRFERTFSSANQPGVSTYEESGRTGFAFWMITDPGDTRTVELTYTVPTTVVSSDYALYIQKQPGLDISNFHFELSKPQDITIESSMPALNKVGDLYTFSGKLDKDLPVSIEFK